MKKNLFLLSAFSGLFSASAQQFVNGDLEGTVMDGQPSLLAPGWSFIPFNDPICEANAVGWATPDLTSDNAPDLPSGLAGIPYSGVTFMSGGYGYGVAGDNMFQEGIKQDVSGFIIGDLYKISFYQSNLKQISATDTSGGWVVYAESTYLDSTDVSISHLNWNDINVSWEYREVIFIATATTHTLKFMPVDDDGFIELNTGAIDGAVRMGIDSLLISSYNCETEFHASVSAIKNNLQADMDDATYQWVDCDNAYAPIAGETSKQFVAQSPGNYAVIISSEFCIDTSACHEIVCADVFSVSVSDVGYELVSDQAGDSYQWVDCGDMTPIIGETNNNFIPVENGSYAVIVSSNGCVDTSGCKTVDYMSVNAENNVIFTLYPNPSTGVVHLSLSGYTSIGEIEITDASGRLVYQLDKQLENNLMLDLGHLNNGIYVLSIKTNDVFQQAFLVLE